MNQYTKGEWKASKSPMGDWVIATEDTLICREARHYDAHLIVAAVNACIKLNPDNPMAVTESIGEMYEALKQIEHDYEAACERKPKNNLLQYRLALLKQSLAKAEGK